MPFGSGVAGGGASGNAPSINPLPGIIQRKAGENISGHRAVCVQDDNKFYLADPATDLDYANTVAGITTGSSVKGADCYARFTGELSDPSFNWLEGPVYLGPGATLTQTFPSSGPIVIIGHAVGPGTLQVRIDFVCNLSE